MSRKTALIAPETPQAKEEAERVRGTIEFLLQQGLIRRSKGLHYTPTEKGMQPCNATDNNNPIGKQK